LINEAVIDTATIATLIAGDLVAERIAASVSLDSPVINGGSITSTTLNVNNQTIINSSGTLTANNAVLSGQITASSGELNDVIIRDTCLIEGKLTAANIEGDVIDRHVVLVDTQITYNDFNGDYSILSGNIIPGVIGANSERTLIISGMVFEHDDMVENSGAGTTITARLLLDGVEQMSRAREVASNFRVDAGNTIKVTFEPSLGCSIPADNMSRSFEIRLSVGGVVVRLKPCVIYIDVFKKGETITNITPPE
jgi:hypothetical protein